MAFKHKDEGIVQFRHSTVKQKHAKKDFWHELRGYLLSDGESNPGLPRFVA
jgi:hypothetical protein